MKIETKYNIGDTVYRMEDNKVKELIIDKISISITKNIYYVEETTTNYGFESENIMYTYLYIFPTKQDLLNNL